MNDGPLPSALNRAEQALGRIERSLAERKAGAGRDDALRQRVGEVVAELDELIREAAQAPNG